MRYQFAIDRGGTFTDCILFDQSTGLWAVTKVLSGPDSPLVGMRKLLGLARSAPIPPCEVRIGTTLATNALLERKGVPTGLLITRGFADLLAIGTQARPDLFALRIEKAPPIYCATEDRTDEAMPLTKLEHYLVISDDIEATRRFYCDALGMREIGRAHV